MSDEIFSEHTADLLLLVLAVLDACHVDGSFVREDESSGFEILVSRI
jgi:hypothetical protein